MDIEDKSKSDNLNEMNNENSTLENEKDNEDISINDINVMDNENSLINKKMENENSFLNKMDNELSLDQEDNKINNKEMEKTEEIKEKKKDENNDADEEDNIDNEENNENIDIDDEDEDDEDEDEEDEDDDDDENIEENNNNEKGKKNDEKENEENTEIDMIDLSGFSRRTRTNIYNRRMEMLNNLKKYDDLILLMTALQSLSGILCVSTEDMFIGNRSLRLLGGTPDEYISALLNIISSPYLGVSQFSDDFGIGNDMIPDVLLLVYRCLNNFLEAFPPCQYHIVQYNGVNILINKLTEIEYIDLAEYILGILNKISIDQPNAILKSNGLLLIVQYIDFYSLHVQRTAISIIGNSCRVLSTRNFEEHFKMIKDIIQILERLITYSDKKLVEGVASSLGNIATWASKFENKIEELFSDDFINIIVQYFLPNNQSQIQFHDSLMFTELLKLLIGIIKGSSKKAFDLVQSNEIVLIIKYYLNINDMDTENISNLNSCITPILINKPINETMTILELLCEILPQLPDEGIWNMKCSGSIQQIQNIDENIISDVKTEKTESKDTISKQKFEYFRKEPLTLLNFGKNILSILIEIFLSSANFDIRKLSVENIAKLIWWINVLDIENSTKYLPEMIKNKDEFGKFLSELYTLVNGDSILNTASEKIDYESFSLLCVGLQISTIILDRNSEYFEKMFIRDGLLSMIDQILLHKENILSYSQKLDQQKAYIRKSSTSTSSETSASTKKNMFESSFLKKKYSFSKGRRRNSNTSKTTKDKDEGAAAMEDIIDSSKSQEQQEQQQLQSQDRNQNHDKNQEKDQNQNEKLPEIEISKNSFEILEKIDDNIDETKIDNDKSESNKINEDENKMEVDEVEDEKMNENSNCNVIDNQSLNNKSIENKENDEDNMVIEDMVIDNKESSVQTKATKQENIMEEDDSRNLNEIENMNNNMDEDTNNQTKVNVNKKTTTTGNDSKLTNSVKSIIDKFTYFNNFPTKIIYSNSVQIIRGLNKRSYILSEVLKWIIWISSSLSENLHKSIVSTDAIFDKIKELAQKLNNFENEDDEDPANIKYLYQIAQFFSDHTNENYITGFEVVKSGLIDSLVTYLKKENSMKKKVKNIEIIKLTEKNNMKYIQRIKAFLHVFLDGPWPYKSEKKYLYVLNSYQNLVIKLQEILSHYENFKIYTGIPATKVHSFDNSSTMKEFLSSYRSSGNMNSVNSQNVAMQLIKQIHLKLYSFDNDNSIIKSMSQMSVTIHAIATFKALEEFVRSRFYPGGESKPNSSDEEDSSPFEVDEDIIKENKNDCNPICDFDSNADLMETEGNNSIAQKDTKKKKRFSGSFLTRLVHNVQKATGSSSKQKSFNKDKEKNKFEIEFYIGSSDNKEIQITNDMTIFGACWMYEQQQQKRKIGKNKKGDTSSIDQNQFSENVDIWKHSYSIYFRKIYRKRSNSTSESNINMDTNAVFGSLKARKNSQGIIQNDENKQIIKRERKYSSSMPECLSFDTIQGKIIYILSVLYRINSKYDDIYLCNPSMLDMSGNSGSDESVVNEIETSSNYISSISKSLFLNSKITAKLSRQLDEPLIIASNVLPQWCNEIAHNFSFLISFDTRVLYLQSTSFGYGRSMARWQQINNQNMNQNQREQPIMGRLQRQKVRVYRNHILESMIKIMPLYGIKNSLLEIEFFNEVGTGLGPTLEFYSLVCNEICKKRIKIWRDSSDENSDTQNNIENNNDRNSKMNINKMNINSQTTENKQENILNQEKTGNNISFISSSNSNIIGNTNKTDTPLNVEINYQENNNGTSKKKILSDSTISSLNSISIERESSSTINTTNSSSITNNSLSNIELSKLTNKEINNEEENDQSNEYSNEKYVNMKNGLFPAPLDPNKINTEAGKKILKIFYCLGIFVAKAMLDLRTIDLPFNIYFVMLIKDDIFEYYEYSKLYYQGSNKNYLDIGLSIIKQIDPQLANSLNEIMKYSYIKKKIYSNTTLTPDELHTMVQNIRINEATIDDLCLDFTLPGYPDIELIENGSNIPVTNWNVEEYIKEIIDFTIGKGVKKQIDFFRKGFNSVFSISNLSLFDADELVLLFGGSQNEDWSYETLKNCIRADHGYTMDSPQIQYLIEVISELPTDERRDFIQFITGCPKLPLGGFKNLQPPLTIVCKTTEPSHQPDEYLPSVMTCVNYLKIPQYSSKKVLKEKLEIAYKEGRGCFHLS